MSRHKRPVIGITGPDTKLAWGWWMGALGVWLAGGRPRRITPERAGSRPALAGVQGLIIGGGDDIDPNLYADVIDLDSDVQGDYDAARDAMEKSVIQDGLAADLPMLGICRGAQLINMARGGNLIADLKPLRKHTSNRWFILPRKTLHVVASSQLARILSRTQLKINSLHHQAVDRVGQNLTRVGQDLDNITQAIEQANAPSGLLLGVQWHPEYMPQSATQRRIFKHLVDCAKRVDLAQ